MVDGHSRVLDATGRAVPGVFRLGLSAGFPLAGTHGEASFHGVANGLSLWNADIGDGIVHAVLDDARASIDTRHRPASYTAIEQHP
jgi:predicted oxidoreductase